MESLYHKKLVLLVRCAPRGEEIHALHTARAPGVRQDAHFLYALT